MSADLEQMKQDLLEQLHTAAQNKELKGTALVQGLRAIASLMPPPEPEKEEVEEFSLFERLPSLPKTHARKLLKNEIARLGSELETHRSALAALEGRA